MSLPQIKLVDGSYLIDGIDGITRANAVDDRGLPCFVWQSESKALSTERRWNHVDAFHIQAGKISLDACLRILIRGEHIVFRGMVEQIAKYYERLFWMLYGIYGDNNQKLLDHLHLMVIRIEKGSPIDIASSRPLPATFWPGLSREMADDSFKMSSYIPAFLVTSLHIEVFESTEKSRGRWVAQRFVNRSTNIFDEAFGATVCVDKGVFIPDPIVVDLLVAAYHDPASPLANDLYDSILLEPCTGSGMLGIVLAMYGAKHVYCSDIHYASVASAKHNIELMGVTDTVSVFQCDGLPSVQTFTQLAFTNPPWIETQDMFKPITGVNALRCFEDKNYQLLIRLLETASNLQTDEFVFYVFQGSKNYFEKHGELPLPIDRRRRWIVTHRWIGNRSLRLYRLKLEVDAPLL